MQQNAGNVSNKQRQDRYKALRSEAQLSGQENYLPGLNRVMSSKSFVVIISSLKELSLRDTAFAKDMANSSAVYSV